MYGYREERSSQIVSRTNRNTRELQRLISIGWAKERGRNKKLLVLLGGKKHFFKFLYIFPSLFFFSEVYSTYFLLIILLFSALDAYNNR